MQTWLRGAGFRFDPRGNTSISQHVVDMRIGTANDALARGAIVWHEWRNSCHSVNIAFLHLARVR
jgi:hypothetical protein